MHHKMGKLPLACVLEVLSRTKLTHNEYIAKMRRAKIGGLSHLRA